MNLPTNLVHTDLDRSKITDRQMEQNHEVMDDKFSIYSDCTSPSNNLQSCK